MPSLASIITPAFQAEAFIGDALRSVLAQTYPHWEMLIVSDDNKDYQTILKQQGISDTRLKFFSTGATGSGPSRGRNVALQAAKGEIIAFLDADDAWSEDYLSVTAPLALAHGMVKTRIVEKVFTSAPHSSAGSLNRPAGLYDATDLPFYINANINMLAKRSAVTQGFPENILFAEDLIFNLQVLGETGVYYFEPAAHYYYHIRDDSMCRGQLSDDDFMKNKHDTFRDIQSGIIKIKHAGLNEKFTQYMKHMVDIEQRFSDSRARGECRSFLEFSKKNRFLFDKFKKYSEPQT